VLLGWLGEVHGFVASKVWGGGRVWCVFIEMCLCVVTWLERCVVGVMC